MAGDSPPVERPPPRRGGPVAALARALGRRFGRRAAARREAEVAERVAQERTALLSALGHELRTPLACVMGYAKLITDTPQASDQTRMLAQRLTLASEDLLAAVDRVLTARGAVPARPTRLAPAPGSFAPSPDGRRALVADDLDINRDLLRLHLTPRGYQVSEAADGAQALAAATSTRFDLIFFDLNMPGADGLATARRLRDGGGPSAGARLFAVSALVMSPELADQLRGAGFDGFIPKPISSATLNAVLAEARP